MDKDMEQKLSVQNVQVTSEEPTENAKSSREKSFMWAFRCIETLWKLVQIVQQFLQVFQ